MSKAEQIPTGLTVLAPVAGTIVAMADVDDPVFSAGFVGPGLAIDPNPAFAPGRDSVDVVAPIDGRIVKMHPHAFVLQAADGRAVLVHLGINTVQLAGEGFTLHVEQDAEVTRGQVLVSWDPAAVVAGGRSAVCPVVALEATADAVTEIAVSGQQVAAGDELLTWG